jgi:serine phosphatase RsbU (regulator of sigma subunit)
MPARDKTIPSVPPLAAIARISAIIVVLLGLITLAGWASGLTLLASVRARYIPMAPSTAFCFALIGGGMLMRMELQRLRVVSAIVAGLVFLVASAKLVEIATGIRFGIDAWLVRDPGQFGAVLTGRMSPITAANFLVVAFALFALTQPRWQRIAAPLGALATLVSGVVLVGYAYGTPLLYGGSVIPVALSTACAFFLCGTAIIALAGTLAWPLCSFLGDSTRALLLRAFVPVILAVTLLNGWLWVVVLARWRVNPAGLSAISALTFAMLVTWIISKVATVVGGRIDRAEAARNQAEAELVALNANLEKRVEERTRELREKNEQMQEEMQMARELQLSLLPRQFPSVPLGVAAQDSALRFLSFYYPTGQVSGDFFTVFPVAEKAVGILICDVMGHGVRAALITSMIRALVVEHANDAINPGTLLTSINQNLVTILKDAGTTMFATAFYLVADVARAELRYSSAGHPPPLHLGHGGTFARALTANGRTGPAMGLFADAGYATSQTAMREGDLVLLFTDGLFEVEDSAGDVFTEEKLLATANRHAGLPPHEMISSIVEEIRGISRLKSFDDDVCVVGIEVQRTG